MSSEKLSPYLHQATLYLFYFLFLVLPLVWYPTLSELFEFPKMVFVYTMTTLILATWIARMIVQKQTLVRKTPFDIPIVLFFVSQLISTLLSMHPRTSIFGYYSRFHGGLLSTLSYTLLYYAFVSNFDGKAAKRALSTILVGALLAALYALPEHFGHSFSCLAVAGNFGVDCWIQDVQTRIYGTFGQPNWLAAYLITLTPITWFGIIRSHQRENRFLFIVSCLLLTVFYAVLLFTRSRSGLLGLGLGFVIFWSLQLVNLIPNFSDIRIFTILTKPFSKKISGAIALIFIWVFSIIYIIKHPRHYLALPFLIISSSLLVISLLFGTEFTPSLSTLIKRTITRQNTSVNQFIEVNSASPSATTTPQKIEVGTVLERGGTESGDIRKIVWQGATDIFTHYPLFGSGVETFAYAYYQFRPVSHNLVSEWDFLYNKAHNEFLNFLATTGIFGLTTYLSVMIAFCIFVLRYSLFLIPNSKEGPKINSSPQLIIGLMSGYIALAVSNFFGFSTVGVGVLFFILPALALTLTQTTLPFDTSTTPDTFDTSSKSLTKKQLRRLHHQTATPPLSRGCQISQPPRLRNLATSGISTFQYIGLGLVLLFTVYCLLFTVRLVRADWHYSQAEKDAKSFKFNSAIDHFQQAIALIPKEATFHNEYSNTLSKAAAAQANNGNNSETVRLAQLAFQESATTLKLNPLHNNFYKSLAGVYIRLSAFDPSLLDIAKTILEDAQMLAPTDAKITYNRALIDLDTGATPSATMLLEKTITIKPNYEDARMKLAEIYQQLGESHKAADQYQYILQHIAPDNSKAKTALEKLAP